MHCAKSRSESGHSGEGVDRSAIARCEDAPVGRPKTGIDQSSIHAGKAGFLGQPCLGSDTDGSNDEIRLERLTVGEYDAARFDRLGSGVEAQLDAFLAVTLDELGRDGRRQHAAHSARRCLENRHAQADLAELGRKGGGQGGGFG